MKKTLNYGKSIVAYVSVFAILAVSMLSVFMGVSFDTFAATRTVVDDWDGSYDYDFIVDNAGDGSMDNPYIISTAEQLASICVPKITDANGQIVDTAGLYFKIANGIKAFYMNGGEEVAAMTSVSDVKKYFETTNTNANYTPYDKACVFKGNFDGNGAIIYGIRGDVKSAALFPYVGGNVTVKNVAVRNSYMAGGWFAAGLIGSANGNAEVGAESITIENCEVSGNYIAFTSTNADRSCGALLGYGWSSLGKYASLTVNNCLVYGNEMSSGSAHAPSAVCGNFNTASISNSVLLGYAPFDSNHTGSMSPGIYTNCYTDYDISTAGKNYSDAQLKRVTKTTGANAKEAMSELNESVWFFSKTAIPQLMIFHDFNATDNGDGTHGALLCCCGLVGLSGSNAHEYDSSYKCWACGYEYPCKDGHTFTEVPAAEPTLEKDGNVAYKACSKCEKNFASNAAIDAPIDSALVDKQIIIPKLSPYDEWNGTYDTTFWMYNSGDGTVNKPFVITTAEQLAAVVTANLKYDNTEVTSAHFSLDNYTLSDNILDTTGLYFEVKSGVTSFYMNGGKDVADMTSVEDVKKYFEQTNTSGSSLVVDKAKQFRGTFNGNGATVYGVYCNDAVAGLFPYAAEDVVIRNLAVKNSYLAGRNFAAAFVGGSNGNVGAKSITLENCEVAGNYIAHTGTNTDRSAGAFLGYAWGGSAFATITLNNCFVHDNEMSSAGGNVPSAICGNFGQGADNFNNSIFLGYAPYVTFGNNYKATMTAGKYNNCYTDADLSTSEVAYNVTQLKQVAKATGKEAKDEMPSLKETTWFFNTTTYPQLKAFHTFMATDNGDGTHGVVTCCCGLEGIYESSLHTYDESNNCTVCGNEYPCKEGHKFTDVPAVEATLENSGNIAYKKCSQCKKNYPDDAAIDAPMSSALTDKQIFVPMMVPYDEWDGTFSTTFWMYNTGDGSASNPFVITTAEQLAAVVTANLRYDAEESTSPKFDINKYVITDGILDTTGLFFEVKTGVTSFYMNGGKELADMTNLADVKKYFEETNPTANSIPADKTKEFKGSFNGNGATVYGVCGDGTAAGLFPYVGGNVVIKNTTVKNSYLKGLHFAGGLISNANGQVGAETITIRNCQVVNNYIAHTGTNVDRSAAAFVGYAWSGNTLKAFAAITLRNCLSYGNEIVSNSGNASSSICGNFGSANDKFINCVFFDYAPYVTFGGSQGATKSPSKYFGCYTNVDLSTANTADKTFEYAENQLAQLATADMLGEKAADNMPELDWVSLWQTNDNSYPTPRLLSVKDYAVGTAWSGETAQEFPAGDGTKGNPYQINTAEYLALMLKSENAGLYYKLTADIIINDTSIENWKDSAKTWFTSDDVAAFEGNLEGDGYTISGLYYSDVEANVSAGIIPVKGSGNVTNVTVSNSYISGKTDAFVGAVIGSVENGAEKPIIMQGVTVEDTVVIEGSAYAGGIVGLAGESILRMGNCISNATINSTGVAGALVGFASQGTSVKNSVAIGTAPIGKVNSATVKNVYTNADTTIDGVTVLASSAMMGDAAAQNMTGLDFENVWTVVSNGYPVLSGTIDISNGVAGDVWSGNVADAYAGGDGSIENPYLIATAEQLARCVTKNEYSKHYKLTSDIYLNDVYSALWESKVGCNEWYNSQRGATWSLFKNGGSFDGDGYVVYGLYYNRVGYSEKNKGAYNALFPSIGKQSLVQNVAISHAHIAGSEVSISGSFSETSGGIVGWILDWDDITLPSSYNARKITSEPEYWAQMPVIKNCLVDHTCYIAGTYAGGILGGANGSFQMYDCIFTGSLSGSYHEYVGGITGQEYSYGSYFINCVSLPQTCDRAYGGWGNSDWRISEGDQPSTIIDGYYFSKYKTPNSGTKIFNPKDRVGEAAVAAMPALDWENTWTSVVDGTPLLRIFAKHRTQEEFELLSNKDFSPPEVKIFFTTNVPGVEIEPLTGKMYSPVTLPTLERAGYTFKGWSVFSDGSMLYPLDYFAPRDLTLYAVWATEAIVQDFEDYANTLWDYDSARWIYNKPGAKGGYKVDYIYDGFKSMHLLDTSNTEADCLLNYKDMLNIGQKYKISFWVTTDNANNPDTVLKLVHNAYPEYKKANKGVEEMVTATGLEIGNWKQYEYEFTAKTPWVSIRAGGNSSLYFDGIFINPVGEDVGYAQLAEYLSTLDVDGGKIITNTNVNTDENTISPDTSENITIAVLVAVVVSCAIIAIISKKNLVEIIEG